jgi:hypothetical protein
MVAQFKTWKHGSVNFLAIHNGATSVVIIDELSRNYGSWASIERFRELQAKGDDLAKPMPGCKVELYGRVTSNEIA